MGCSSFLTSFTAHYIVHPRGRLRHRQVRHFTTPKTLQFARLLNSLRPCRTSRAFSGESPSPAISEQAGGAVVEEDDAEKRVLGVPFPPLPVDFAESVAFAVDDDARNRTLERQLRRKSERTTYLFAAVASTVGITFLTAGAVYYRFAWQTQGSEVPLSEMFATFALAVGASVGMEFWARWAHEALWHDSLWSMHESHHRPRDGPFEMNDIFAIINAGPAIALMAYGFFHRGLVPGLCFGAGLGITVFGIAYMFVHDGLVHRRFPVGPIADVPYFQKVAAAHQLHHADKFKGVPYGLFLGPQELEAQAGGAEELERMIEVRKKLNSSNH